MILSHRKTTKHSFPHFEALRSELLICNSLQTEYKDSVNLLKTGMTTEQADIKLKLSKPPATGVGNYQNLQEKWKQDWLSLFKVFLPYYNKKEFSMNAKNGCLLPKQRCCVMKLGCRLPNLASIALHKSTDTTFFQSIEADKDLLENILEDVNVGTSIIFARQSVADETFKWRSANICKPNAGIDANQLYPY